MDKFINKYGYISQVPTVMDQSLTNFDIDDLIKKLKIPNFRGVFMRDTLPKRPRRVECGIMNFNTSAQSGSHWVCWYKSGSHRIYFDSFGCICPDELQRYLKTATEYKNDTLCIQRNTDQVQQPNTRICGQLCLYILKQLSDGRKFQDVIHSLKKNSSKIRRGGTKIGPT